MAKGTEKDVEYRFPASLALDEIQRLATDMWSDLAFDEQALARLRRDGLALDGLRLTGPTPFQIASAGSDELVVTIAPSVSDPMHIATLLDLWRLHFMKGLRPGSIAA